MADERMTMDELVEVAIAKTAEGKMDWDSIPAGDRASFRHRLPGGELLWLCCQHGEMDLPGAGPSWRLQLWSSEARLAEIGGVRPSVLVTMLQPKETGDAVANAIRKLEAL